MKYKETHPWMTFDPAGELKEAGAAFWVMLGEARSKCDFLSKVAIHPDLGSELLRMRFVKGVQATIAIEGNTLSEADVLAQMQGTPNDAPSKEYQVREADNIICAYNRLARQLRAGELPALTPDLIKGFNRQVLEGLPEKENVRPGQISERLVVVSNYGGAPREDCEHLLQRLCEVLTECLDEENGLDRKDRGILAAVISHLYLAWIHPFGDGNGRTARLLEFLVLIKSGVPMIASHLLSNHYMDTREDYYRHLKQASERCDALGFYRYALQGLVDGLRDQAKVVLNENVRLAWNNLMHDWLPDDRGGVSDRKRHLVFDLGRAQPDFAWPLSADDLVEYSPRSARAYGPKTPQTLARDLKYLIGAGVLIKEGPRGRLNHSVMQPFMSPSAGG